MESHEKNIFQNFSKDERCRYLHIPFVLFLILLFTISVSARVYTCTSPNNKNHKDLRFLSGKDGFHIIATDASTADYWFLTDSYDSDENIYHGSFYMYDTNIFEGTLQITKSKAIIKAGQQTFLHCKAKK